MWCGTIIEYSEVEVQSKDIVKRLDHFKDIKDFSIINYLKVRGMSMNKRLNCLFYIPSRYIEFIDRDTEIDYKSAPTEMSRKFDELKKRWDANEAELVNAFKILEYGKE